jgi:lipoate---protein ligase
VAWALARSPALVLGRSAAAAPVDEAACREAGVPVLRRGSGGGPVLWDEGLLALDVALPGGHPLAPVDVVAAYAWLGAAVAEGLRALGLPAHRLEPDEARRSARRAAEVADPAAIACFGGLSPHEVLVDGRKVLGLAQVRRRGATLLQAGILLSLDAEGLAALLALDGARAPFAAALRARAAGLDELAPHVGAHDVVEAVEQAFAGARLTTITAWPPSPTTAKHAAPPAAGR